PPRHWGNGRMRRRRATVPDVDAWLREGLRRLARIEEGDGVFEVILSRKGRRRVRHRLGVVTLAVVVLVCTGAASFGLVRAFHPGRSRVSTGGAVGSGRIAV